MYKVCSSYTHTYIHMWLQTMKCVASSYSTNIEIWREANCIFHVPVPVLIIVCRGSAFVTCGSNQPTAPPSSDIKCKQ